MALSETLSETSLCNIGLGKLGDKRIDNVETDSSLQAIQCRLHYEPTRNALLRSHWWRFASTRIKLVSAWVTVTAYTTDQYVSNDSVWYKCATAHTSSSATEPPHANWTTLSASAYTPDSDEWDLMWDLPADFLAMKSIYENRFSDENLRSYALEGQIILTNENSVEIRYIKKVTDVTKFDPLFIEVLTWLLADKMIGPLAGGDDRIQKKIDTALDRLMPSVRALDRQETNTIGECALGTWNNARYA